MAPRRAFGPPAMAVATAVATDGAPSRIGAMRLAACALAVGPTAVVAAAGPPPAARRPARAGRGLSGSSTTALPDNRTATGPPTSSTSSGELGGRLVVGNATSSSSNCTGCNRTVHNASNSSAATTGTASSVVEPALAEGGSGGGMPLLLMGLSVAVTATVLLVFGRRRVRCPWSSRQPVLHGDTGDVQLTTNLGDWMAADDDEDDVTIGGPLSSHRFTASAKEDTAYYDLSTPRG